MTLSKGTLFESINLSHVLIYHSLEGETYIRKDPNGLLMGGPCEGKKDASRELAYHVLGQKGD